MRILYVAAGMPIPGSHGGSVHALQLCRALSRAGHEVHLAAQPPDEAGAGAVDLEGVIVHRLPPPLLEQLEFTRHRKVRWIAEGVEPEVIIERFYTFGGSGLLAARRVGVPAVLEVNSPARTYPGSLRDRLDALTLVRPVDRWRRWQLRNARAYYATSALLLPERLRPQTTVIVNGVDCARIRPGAPAPDHGPLRCVYVSSFRTWHGAVDLVRAVARLLQDGVDVRLTAIGDGPTQTEARRVAADTGAARYIDFVGRIRHSEVSGYLAQAHVGVAPFSPEQHRALEIGWFWSPIKIFEYLAAGLPVVTAAISDLQELLPEPVARFYSAGNSDDLAAAIASLAADRAALRAAGTAARRVAEERFTWDRQAEVVAGVLERAVRPRDGAQDPGQGTR